jgi:hypothetical protein
MHMVNHVRNPIALPHQGNLFVRLTLEYFTSPDPAPSRLIAHSTMTEQLAGERAARRVQYTSLNSHLLRKLHVLLLVILLSIEECLLLLLLRC